VEEKELEKKEEICKEKKEGGRGGGKYTEHYGGSFDIVEIKTIEVGEAVQRVGRSDRKKAQVMEEIWAHKMRRSEDPLKEGTSTGKNKADMKKRAPMVARIRFTTDAIPVLITSDPEP